MKEKYTMHNGYYRCRIYIGTDENGKKKYKDLSAKEEKDLTKKVENYKKKLKLGLKELPQQGTLSFWIYSFLEMKKKEVQLSAYKESDYKTLSYRLQFFLEYDNKSLANTCLDKITKNQIQVAINCLHIKNPTTNKKSSKRTLNKYLSALKLVFRYAQEERAYLYAFSPCDGVKIPQNAQIKDRIPINDYTKSLIEETPHRGQLPCLVVLWTGLRRGELTELKWSDIDFENNLLHVARSFDFKSKEVKLPKSKAGIRTIPIDTMISNLLLEYKQNQNRETEFVFEKKSGGRMTETAWKRMLESYLDLLKLTDEEKKANSENVKMKERIFMPFKLHQLRHTYCTDLSRANVDIKTAQALMGHSDYTTTANIYTHFSQDKIVDAVTKLAEFRNNSVA